MVRINIAFTITIFKEYVISIKIFLLVCSVFIIQYVYHVMNKLSNDISKDYRVMNKLSNDISKAIMISFQMISRLIVFALVVL